MVMGEIVGINMYVAKKVQFCNKVYNGNGKWQGCIIRRPLKAKIRQYQISITRSSGKK
jgi:hypothetical protein